MRKRESLLQPNIVFIHSFIALLICSLVKITTGNILIPDKAVPLTLEVIILCLSLLYITFPHVYNFVYKFCFYKVSILNQIGNQLIVIFSVAYILLACLAVLFLEPINIEHLYWLTHITPPIVYILCIIANYITLDFISRSYSKLPVIRIIAISEGCILVSKRGLSYLENDKLDTPIEGNIFDSFNILDKARKISALSLGINTSEADPRFCIRYKSKFRFTKDVLLFILPIKNRNSIRYKYCRFVSPDEIKENIDKYSSYIKDEINHLSIAAQIWKEQNI